MCFCASFGCLVLYFIFSASALDCYYIRKRRPGASSGSKCIHRKAALASPSAPRHTHTTTPTPTRHTPRTRTQTHKRTQRTKEKWETEIVALYYKPTICWRHNLQTLKEPILGFAQESTPICFFFLSVATLFFKNKFCSCSILFCRVRLMFNSTLFEFQLFLSLWLFSSFGIQITQRERQRRRHRCRCRTGTNSEGRKEGERKKERNKMDRRRIKRNWEGKRDGWTCLSVPHSRTTSQAKRESAVPSSIRRERKGKKEREEETNQTNYTTRLLGFEARRCVRIVERPQRDWQPAERVSIFLEATWKSERGGAGRDGGMRISMLDKRCPTRYPPHT